MDLIGLIGPPSLVSAGLNPLFSQLCPVGTRATTQTLNDEFLPRNFLGIILISNLRASHLPLPTQGGHDLCLPFEASSSASTFQVIADLRTISSTLPSHRRPAPLIAAVPLRTWPFDAITISHSNLIGLQLRPSPLTVRFSRKGKTNLYASVRAQLLFSAEADKLLALRLITCTIHVS